MCVTAWVYVHLMHTVAAETRRGRWIPWDWSNTNVGPLNSTQGKKQYVLLTAKPSPRPQKEDLINTQEQ